MEGLVRNIGGFYRFLEVASAASGELLNFSNVARECRLPVRTVQSYYEILEDTLVGYRLLPWMKSARKRLGVASLPDDDYRIFRQWFLNRDWEKWDLQMEADTEGGRLAFLLDEASLGKRNGALRDL